VAVPGVVAAQDPAGVEFAVTDYTTASQLRPAVAADANGDFVVTWVRYSATFLENELFARAFTASGAPKGPELQVNVHTTGSQTRPAVAADDLGNFVVVWDSDGQDGSGPGVFGRRFDSSGVPLGGEFAVATYTTGTQTRPSVAVDGAGGFVVAWYGDGPGGFAVFGRRFDASGAPLGPEFPVSTFTTGGQLSPDVAADAAGNFVVAWMNYTPRGIRARRFDAAGAPLGADFEVRTHLTGSASFPDVDVGRDGGFTVVWTKSSGEPSGGPGAFGRRFDAAGAPEGPQFQITTYSSVVGAGWEPEVALDGHGNFVVAWWGYQPGDHLRSVIARRFDTGAVPLSDTFRVNTYTTDHQHLPSVASDPDGDFVVAWTSRQFGTRDSIFVQRYGDLIFQDGFETSDLSRWSAAQTDGFDLDAAGGAAAMGGTATGLQAFVDDTNPLFVQDDTPGAEDRYRARFYFDPNGFDPGEAAGFRRVRLFIGFSAAGERLVTVVLRRLGGEFAVAARLRRDDGTREETGFFPITDAPHVLELDWMRSSGPGAYDGQFVLRLDETVVSTLFGIDNDRSPLEFARLGVMTLKTPLASGTVFFDQFESRRRRYVGPEPGAGPMPGP
jgi:hypothetical protein